MDAERAVLEQERITAVRQRNDESRAPTQWASDTCEARDSTRVRARTLWRLGHAKLSKH